jgi:hypothetical protein
MNLTKSFGNEVADGVLEDNAVDPPERVADHRQDGPARFWADPPPGRNRIAA